MFIHQSEGLIDYKIYTYGGMSGSPIYIKNVINNSYEVIGIHHGRLSEYSDRTGGCFLHQENREKAKDIIDDFLFENK